MTLIYNKQFGRPIYREVTFPENSKNNMSVLIDKWSRHLLGLKENDTIPLPGSGLSLSFPLLNSVYNHVVDVGGCKALDALENEFIIDQNNFDIVLRKLIVILIDVKKKKYDIKIEDALLYTDFRFCVFHNDTEGNKPDKSILILDFPTDIFKFLEENNYDQSIINNLMDCQFNISYDAISIFKKALKIGKDFKAKRQLLDTGNKESKLDLMEYLTRKYNATPYIKVYKEVERRYPNDINNILNRLLNVAINDQTFFSRVYNGMSIEEAIGLGIEERCTYNYTNSQYMDNRKLREVFYQIIREEISKTT